MRVSSMQRCLVPSFLTVAGLYLTPTSAMAVGAARANDFLNSIGVNTHMKQGGDLAWQVDDMLLYTGIRNIREEGDSSIIPTYAALHDKTGVKFVLVQSGPNDASIGNLLGWSKTLASTGALLAMEGPNEPNNWALTYQGQSGGGSGTFVPVANWQRDFYSQAKADSVLKNYPVFHSSEAGGSEQNNAGLQFLTIPSGAGTLMPDGTQFADYANVHNYMSAWGLTGGAPHDNQVWNAADPTSSSHADGMYKEYGNTWLKHFTGYTTTQLQPWTGVPRVTTETGWQSGTGSNLVSEAQQGKLYINAYLAQYAQGFSYTFIYMLKDDASQGTYGMYHTDYTPKLAATYLHNMTTILGDTDSTFTAGSVNYSIASKPSTVHDLLLQKGDGTFELVVWDEKNSGTNSITVALGQAFPYVNIYDPTVGETKTQTLTNASSVALTLSDHPVILELTTVPEPTGLGWVVAGAIFALRRRTRA